MLNLKRTHDFQVFLSPKHEQASQINPPSFNWPQQQYKNTYTLELEHLDKSLQWQWSDVSSPFQLPFLLTLGQYRWRLTDAQNQITEWSTFSITEQSECYLPPTAQELFEQCQEHDQFLMYFDEDIQQVRINSWTAFDKLKKTSELVDIDSIVYPDHYIRGKEEGKRTAIANVRKWIDRDLISLTLLFKIWDDKTSGDKAVSLLLKLAEWSPEGPASLLRPCTWGDEVGLSLSRNLFLAYHWLSPLLTESEKDFIRPMLIRIAFQMEERLEQDQFKQYPGHSHTSRLPSYLGIAALALHKECDIDVCERWLNYAIMIYQGVLPFYGGDDGSWAEGPFYSSSYTKWYHPFFLTVERLSQFSFYNHPFYKSYHEFAMDFVADDESIHPFGDGFWCKRDGLEWPGFFAQNPLRVYADRFGNKESRTLCRELELNITSYDLHLLDVVPTIHQIELSKRPMCSVVNTELSTDLYHKYYPFSGLGKVKYNKSALYFRASPFGNSSHRHADQGNIAFIDSGMNVLTPSGSYGYRFGSKHHSEWTRTTKAHNLPLINQQGQILDDESAVATVLSQESGANWYVVQLDLSKAYSEVRHYVRTMIVIDNDGLLIFDHIKLDESKSVQWRLHSELSASQLGNDIMLNGEQSTYQISLSSHPFTTPSIHFGYEDEAPHDQTIVSDATSDIHHIEWELDAQSEHHVAACCAKSSIDYHVLDRENVTIALKSSKLIVNLSTGNAELKELEAENA